MFSCSQPLLLIRYDCTVQKHWSQLYYKKTQSCNGVFGPVLLHTGKEGWITDIYLYCYSTTLKTTERISRSDHAIAFYTHGLDIWINFHCFYNFYCSSPMLFLFIWMDEMQDRQRERARERDRERNTKTWTTLMLPSICLEFDLSHFHNYVPGYYCKCSLA